MGRPFWMGSVSLSLFEDQFNYGTPTSPVPPDPLKWIIVSGGPNNRVNGSELEQRQDWTNSAIKSIPTFSPPTQFEFRIFPSTVSSAYWSQWGLRATLGGGLNLAALMYDGPADYRFQTYRDGAVEQTSISPFSGVYKTMLIVWTTSKVECWLDGILSATHTIQIPNGPLPVYMQRKLGPPGPIQRCDYVKQLA